MRLHRMQVAFTLALLLGPAAALATDPIEDNVVQNSFFDAGVASWTATPPPQPAGENEVSIVFDASRDLADDAGSGSAQVLSRSPFADKNIGAMLQCVPIDEDRAYLLAGAILFPTQTTLNEFTARFKVRFYASAICTSPIGAWITAASQNSTSTRDVWYDETSSPIAAPSGAQSAELRAEIQTTSVVVFGQTVKVNFDSITFVPEPGLALAQLAAVAALAAVRRRR